MSIFTDASKYFKQLGITNAAQSVGNQVASLPQQFQALGQLIHQNNAPTPQINNPAYKFLEPWASIQSNVQRPLTVPRGTPLNFQQPIVPQLQQRLVQNPIPQQFGAMGSLINQGLRDQSQLPKPVNNYLSQVINQPLFPKNFFDPQANLNSFQGFMNAPDRLPLLGSMRDSAFAPNFPLDHVGSVLAQTPAINRLMGQTGNIRLGKSLAKEAEVMIGKTKVKPYSTVEQIMGDNKQNFSSAIEDAKDILKKSGTYFHGSTRDGITELRASTDGNLGDGVYLAKTPGMAQQYAAGQSDGNIADVYTYEAKVNAKKLFKTDAMSLEPDEIAKIKSQGYEGIETPHETVIFDKNNVNLGKMHQPDTGASPLQPKEDALNFALNWQNMLVQRGFKPMQIDRIGPSAAREIIANDTTPEQWAEKYLAGTGYKSALPPAVDVSNQAAQRAETISAMSEGKVNNLDDTTKQAFKDWVNGRRASRVEGLVAQNKFVGLDPKGLKGIFEFQAGDKSGSYGEVKNFFDSKYNQLQHAGIEFNFKRDYLPQLWANTPQQVEQVLGRRLGLKPGFTLEAVIKDYEEGISKGLTPRYQNISQLVGNYEQRANKALSDIKFFNHLKDEGFIQPTMKAPYGWVTLNPDRFPKVKVSYEGNQTYQGTFSAPPELAGMVNNYLKEPSGLLNNVANFVSAAKNRALSFGVPGTAINAHGTNILARHTLFGSGGNPVSRLFTATHYMLNQGAAESELNKILSTAPDAVKSGLTLSTEVENSFVSDLSKLNKFGKVWNNLFEKPLFERMIPALKLSSYNELIKNGKMDPQDASTMINNVYGGINWEAVGRDRDFQNVLRTFILAPDWAESNLKLGGNMLKSFTNNSPVAQRYRTMVATMFGAYISANIANKLSSGHYMYENEPGHTMEIESGKTGDGQTRYFRPFGTAADFVRLPYDAVIGLLKGDPTPIFRTVANRLSIPAGAAVGLLTNTDYRGQAIYGKNKYGQELSFGQSAVGIGGQIAQAAGLPSFIKQGADTVSGKQGAEQGLLQGFELPVRYSGGNFSKSGQLLKKLDSFPTEQQNQRMAELKKANPSLYAQVRRLKLDEVQGVTDKERKIRELPVRDGSRIKAVSRTIIKLSPQDQTNLIQEWRAKGIITDEVMGQLRLLKREGRL